MEGNPHPSELRKRGKQPDLEPKKSGSPNAKEKRGELSTMRKKRKDYRQRV